MTYHVEHLFIYLFAIYMSSLLKFLFRSLVYFFIGVVCYLIIEFYEFLAYFEKSSFIRYMFYQYFLIFCGLSPYSLDPNPFLGLEDRVGKK